jgi:hypothetical protein
MVERKAQVFNSTAISHIRALGRFPRYHRHPPPRRPGGKARWPMT